MVDLVPMEIEMDIDTPTPLPSNLDFLPPLPIAWAFLSVVYWTGYRAAGAPVLVPDTPPPPPPTQGSCGARTVLTAQDAARPMPLSEGPAFKKTKLSGLNVKRGINKTRETSSMDYILKKMKRLKLQETPPTSEEAILQLVEGLGDVSLRH